LIIAKLRLLGITGGGSATAHALAWAYTALLLWLAWRARHGASDRRSQVLVWLAMLNLAALRSPLAPSARIRDGALVLWSLAVIAADVRGKYWMAIALAVVDADHGSAAAPGQSRPRSPDAGPGAHGGAINVWALLLRAEDVGDTDHSMMLMSA
jgi:hypothetical protein